MPRQSPLAVPGYRAELSRGFLMLWATGFGRASMPWGGRARTGVSRRAFVPGVVRTITGFVLVALLVGNAVLFYRLTEDDAEVVRPATSSARVGADTASARDLQTVLQAVEAAIRKDVEDLTVRYREARDRPRETSSERTALPDASGPAGVPSTGSSSGGSTSADSDPADTGSGGGSTGGTPGGGDTSGGSSDGSGGGSSGSSGGGDTGGTGSGGGGSGPGGGGTGGGDDGSGGGDDGGGGGGGGG
jgi:hypothetical protein